MRIAYIGRDNGISLHLARALERLGHEVTLVDPWRWLGRSRWAERWVWHAGAFGVSLRLDRALFSAVAAARPELIFVCQGEFLGQALIMRLRTLGVPLVNYTNDNPFSHRDGPRFRQYFKALRHYDLLAVVRHENVAQARLAGARDVVRVWFTADEVAHRPRQIAPDIRKRYSADVSFIGTWMPERGPFLAELIRRGVPLSIWGDRWHKSPEWSVIEPHWRGNGIYGDDQYAAAVLSAKICLGLLSKGNRDLHTTRSMEIPAIGGLLCAERTTEHLTLYDEDRDAVFWRGAEECAIQCHRMLADESLRRSIARCGQQRAQRNNHYNESMLRALIERAVGLSKGGVAN